MSLEMTLTLALATIILAVGLVVRVVVMSLFRLARFALGGAYRRLTRPRIEDALPRPTMRDRLRPARRGLRTAFTTAIGAVRSAYRWMVRQLDPAYRWVIREIGGVFVQQRDPLGRARAPSGGRPLGH